MKVHLYNKLGSIVIPIGFAGTPAMTCLGSTSFVTTAPAPISACSPIITGPIIVAF
jgi:hypothetical protein